MPRSIIFGNQSLLVCVDKHYYIRDIYYPHVGMENHLNSHKCRIGIWVNNSFTWLESDEWVKDIKYTQDTLVGESVFVNKGLSTQITIRDCVYHKLNIFLRTFQIENLSNNEREYRIFFSHDLQIYGTNIGITAYYDPDTMGVIHYLKDRWFLFNGRGDNDSINSYSTGKAHFGDSEGTFRDAEDGILAENPIDQGTVDSTIQINLNVKAKESNSFEYWFTVGESYKEVKELDRYIKELGVSKGIAEVVAFNKTWANKSNFDYFDLPENIIKLFKQSLLIIISQMDKGGAIIAANDSDIMHYNRDHYSYMWPRDGALVAMVLGKAGYAFLTRKFYKFCSNLLTPKGFLSHKYNPDGSLGSSWHPWFNKEEGSMLAIQEDETALVIFTLWEHYKDYKDLDLIAEMYPEFIVPAADFLVDFKDERNLPLPSYDLWEERRGIHTFTVCSVYAGLIAAANFANLFGDSDRVALYLKTAKDMKNAMIKYLYEEDLNRFLRTINFRKDGTIKKDFTIDASLYAIFEFNVFSSNDPRVISTMNHIKEKLWVKTKCGGIARYENDPYYRISNEVPGNPWFICTLWLAGWYIKRAKERKDMNDLKESLNILNWVSEHTLSSGILAEQLNPDNEEPISVSPLTWSHATYALTVLEYINAYSVANTCPTCMHSLPIKKEEKEHIDTIKFKNLEDQT